MIVTLFSENADTKNIADNLINYHFIDYKLFSFRECAENIYFEMFDKIKPENVVLNEKDLEFVYNIRNTIIKVPDALINNLINYSLNQDIIVYDGIYLEEAEELKKRGNINILILDENSKSSLNKDFFEIVVYNNENVIEDILKKIKDR